MVIVAFFGGMFIGAVGSIFSIALFSISKENNSCED